MNIPTEIDEFNTLILLKILMLVWNPVDVVGVDI